MASLTEVILDLEGETLNLEEQEQWLQIVGNKSLTNYLQTQIYKAQELAGNLGKGVKIGIIDSGVDYNHDQFRHIKEQLKKGINLSESSDTDDLMDNYGHGTQVTGIICGEEIGIVPEAEIYVVKFRESNVKNPHDYTNAIVIGLTFCEEKGCDVINMSLGTPRHYLPLEEACQKAYDKNILLVASSGNTFIGANFPATYSKYVISVGSVNSELKHVESSNVWPSTEIVAPGRRIFSADKRNKYFLGDGTSYATPHITGILGLAIATMKQAGKPINPDKIRQVLRKTANRSVIDNQQARTFMRNYDPDRKILKKPKNVAQFMFGAGLVQAEDLIRKLIR